MSKRQTPYWPFKGGMDIVTPPITVKEGRMIAGSNFEPWIDGGYRRIKGYERYDGHDKPSDASWQWMELDAPFAPQIFDALYSDKILELTPHHYWKLDEVSGLPVDYGSLGITAVAEEGSGGLIYEADPLLTEESGAMGFEGTACFNMGLIQGTRAQDITHVFWVRREAGQVGGKVMGMGDSGANPYQGYNIAVADDGHLTFSTLSSGAWRY